MNWDWLNLVAVQRWLNSTTIALGLAGLVLVILSAASWLPLALSHLARDIGFAFWVAIVVYVLFELRSRQEFESTLQREFHAQSEEINEIVRKQDERLTEKVSLIASNVFFGVYQRNLPRPLINEASIVVLEQDLVKRDIFLRYTIQDRTYKNEDGNECPFVCLITSLSFSTTNISSKAVAVPIGVILPNPLVQGMIEATGVQQCRWRLERDATWFMLDAPKLASLNNLPLLAMHVTDALLLGVHVAPSIRWEGRFPRPSSMRYVSWVLNDFNPRI